MADTEWWQRGPVDGVPAMLQPVAHVLLQLRDELPPLVEGLTASEWNARPAGVASAAFHVRHIAGVFDRLFAYARGDTLTDAQRAALKAEGDAVTDADVSELIPDFQAALMARLADLGSFDAAHLADFRGIGRAQLPSTVLGCLVHAAEHGMRHLGQLSVTVRVVRNSAR
jgi:uncharacterized damage-inducible protein DinB